MVEQASTCTHEPCVWPLSRRGVGIGQYMNFVVAKLALIQFEFSVVTHLPPVEVKKFKVFTRWGFTCRVPISQKRRDSRQGCSPATFLRLADRDLDSIHPRAVCDEDPSKPPRDRAAAKHQIAFRVFGQHGCAELGGERALVGSHLIRGGWGVRLGSNGASCARFHHC